jgi:hypothetical protein
VTTIQTCTSTKCLELRRRIVAHNGQYLTWNWCFVHVAHLHSFGKMQLQSRSTILDLSVPSMFYTLYAHTHIYTRYLRYGPADIIMDKCFARWRQASLIITRNHVIFQLSSVPSRNSQNFKVFTALKNSKCVTASHVTVNYASHSQERNIFKHKWSGGHWLIIIRSWGGGLWKSENHQRPNSTCSTCSLCFPHALQPFCQGRI